MNTDATSLHPNPLADLPEAYRWAAGVFIVLVTIVFGWWISRDKDGDEAKPTSARRQKIPWQRRFKEAEETIRELIESLPSDIKEVAKQVQLILEKWPPSGANQETLGVYRGFESGAVSHGVGPIVIYIGPHHQYCAEKDIQFAREIRRTYLHELGHHLGLDESDLEDRGIGAG